MPSDSYRTLRRTLHDTAQALSLTSRRLESTARTLKDATTALQRAEARARRSGHLARAAESARDCLTIVAAGILLGIGVPLVTIVLVKEILRDDYLLDPILVSEKIQKMGYTGEVAASKLVDEIDVIRRAVRPGMLSTGAGADRLGLAQALRISSRSKLPEAFVPEAGISLQGIAQLLQEAISSNPRHIGGELVETRDGLGAYLTIRLDTLRSEPLKVSLDSIDAGFVQAGQQFVRLTRPCLLAAYSYTLGDVSAAFEAIHACFREEANRNDASIQNLYGLLLADSGRYEEATRAYRRATELDPRFAEAHSNWGNVLYSRAFMSKSAEQAVTLLREAGSRYATASNLAPRLAQAHNGWGQVLGLVAEMVDGEATAARRAGHSAQATFLSDSARALYDSATSHFGRAIRLDSTMSVAHINHGWARFLRAKRVHPPVQSAFDSARSALERAIAIAPDVAMAYNDLGVVLFDQPMRNDSVAVAMYQRAIELDSTLPHPFANMGEVLKWQGRCKEAKRYLQKAIRLDSRGLVARFATDQLRQLAC